MPRTCGGSPWRQDSWRTWRAVHLWHMDAWVRDRRSNSMALRSIAGPVLYVLGRGASIHVCNSVATKTYHHTVFNPGETSEKSNSRAHAQQ